MMDRERFELTPEERKPYLYKVSTSPEPYAFGKDDGTLVSPHIYSHIRIAELLKAQVSKVLSLLEPVELEALGDEEIMTILKEAYPKIIPQGAFHLVIGIIKATLQKNQSKGQLYRIRGEKEFSS